MIDGRKRKLGALNLSFEFFGKNGKVYEFFLSK
jgi:hypothetical protein